LASRSPLASCPYYLLRCTPRPPAPKHLVGVDQRGKFPAGTDPYVLGESANTIITYGCDPVTNIPESKVTLCQITAA
jgi:hypothetical protein